MARQISLLDTVNAANATQGDRADASTPKKAAPAPRKRAQRPQKASAARSTGAKPKTAQIVDVEPNPELPHALVQGGTGGGKSKATKSAQPATAKPSPPAAEPHELPRREQPHIRGVATGDAVRLNLYIHPDDAHWLRTEGPRGTTQNVFRAMIAVMRHNKQVTEQVGRLSASGPRGEH